MRTSGFQRASLIIARILAGSVTTAAHACARRQCQTGVRHMFADRGKTESCLVKAPASHVNESVRVTNEPWCTRVQSETQTRNVRVKCAHVGNDRHTCAAYPSVSLRNHCEATAHFEAISCSASRRQEEAALSSTDQETQKTQLVFGILVFFARTTFALFPSLLFFLAFCLSSYLFFFSLPRLFLLSSCTLSFFLSVFFSSSSLSDIPLFLSYYLNIFLAHSLTFLLS